MVTGPKGSLKTLSTEYNQGHEPKKVVNDHKIMKKGQSEGYEGH